MQHLVIPAPERPARRKIKPEIIMNVRMPGAEILRSLGMQEDVPWNRGAMMRAEVLDCLMERADGPLGPSSSTMEHAPGPLKVRKAKPFPPARHVLVPDARSLEVHGESYFESFLEKRGLIDQVLREEGKRELASIRAQVVAVIKQSNHLQLVAERWYRRAGVNR